MVIHDLLLIGHLHVLLVLLLLPLLLCILLLRDLLLLLRHLLNALREVFLEAADELADLCELLLAAAAIHHVANRAGYQVLYVVGYHVVGLLFLLVQLHLAPQVIRVLITYSQIS